MKHTKLFWLLPLLGFLFFFAACEEEATPPPSSTGGGNPDGGGSGSKTITIEVEGGANEDEASIVVTADVVSNITTTSADVTGSFARLDPNNPVLDYGHCWSTNPEPTVNDSKTSFGSRTEPGVYISELRGLRQGTTYYVRTYIVTEDWTGYHPETTTFKTDDQVLKELVLEGDLNFGDVTVGESVTKSLTLRNTGNAEISVSSLTLPQGFSGNTSGNIAPGSSLTANITFSPSTNGTYQGDLVVNSDATSGTTRTSVFGRGVEPTRLLSLSGNLSFGEVEVGDNATLTFTIQNNGNSDLEVYNIIYPSDFTGNWSGKIGAGQSVDVQVTFAPSTVKNYSGRLEINSGATSGGNTLALSGKGDYAVTGGLAVYYLFDNNLDDYSGNVPNTFSEGSFQFSTDSPNGNFSTHSAQFDGSSALLRTPHNVLAGAQTVTINVWVKTSDRLATICIGSDGDQSFPSYGLILDEDNSGNRGVTHYGRWRYMNLPSSLFDGSWHMLTVSYGSARSSNYKVYVDGALYAQESYNGGLSGDTSGGFYIGALSWGSQSNQRWAWFSGKMDNFRIYNRQLSDSEVQRIYTARQ